MLGEYDGGDTSERRGLTVAVSRRQELWDNRALARSGNQRVRFPGAQTIFPRSYQIESARDLFPRLVRTPTGTRTFDRHFRQFDVSLIHKTPSE